MFFCWTLSEHRVYGERLLGLVRGLAVRIKTELAGRSLDFLNFEQRHSFSAVAHCFAIEVEIVMEYSHMVLRAVRTFHVCII